VGLTYNLGQRQNYTEIPRLTRERVRNALESAITRAETVAASGKKLKTKPGDDLRKGLASTISEVPPVVVDHCLLENDFKLATKLPDVRDNEELFEQLFKALQDARQLVDEVGKEGICKGYIIAKVRPGVESAQDQQSDFKREDLLYDDFHPFLPSKFRNNPEVVILTFDGFNKTVDEFYSSIEGQKLNSRLNDRERAAQSRLEATKTSQAKKIEGLKEAQLLNYRKASAIEANVERVQETMDAINGLIEEGMDWVDIGKLVEREQKRDNPVASIIKLPLKLKDNTITLLLAEAIEDDEESGYRTESDDDSDDEVAALPKGKTPDSRLEVDIILSHSPWTNAGMYFGEKKSAAEKEEKTALQSATALRNAGVKIKRDLKKGLKQEKPAMQLIRQPMWFEKFIWFLSSDGYLVLGGKDAVQDELLYRRHLRKGDIYCHSDVQDASVVVIKNNPMTPDAPIPPSTVSQAGTLCVCTSDAWDSKAGFGAWWVAAEQVSKTAAGQILADGVFHISGEKNHLPPAQLVVGLGLVFKVSKESKSRKAKHLIYQSVDRTSATATSSTLEEQPASQTKDENEELADTDSAVGVMESASMPEEDDQMDDEEQDHQPRANPLQFSGSQDDDANAGMEAEDAMEFPSIQQEPVHGSSQDVEGEPEIRASEGAAIGQAENDDGEASVTISSTPMSSRPASIAPSEMKTPAKRGQKGKAKKIAAKYKHQDEEDRAAAEAILGAATGRRKAEEEARAKAQREVEAAAQQARRKEQQERRQKQTAAHEAARRKRLEEGGDDLEGDHDQPDLTVVEDLVGTPLPGDEILTAIPICAPYSAMAKLKYKVKMQPGAVKKGKAVKEIVERWVADSSRKGVVDEKGEDPERMWPREVELIKGLRMEDFVNIVPVGKVRIMMIGGSGGGGNSKGQQQKGGKGGKGGKK